MAGFIRFIMASLQTKITNLKEWNHTPAHVPVKVRVIPSAGNVLASVLEDCQVVLLIDCIEK